MKACLFDVELLLSAPINRGGYSDRVSLLMCVLSKLAYLKYEKDEQDNKKLIDHLAELGLQLVDILNDEGTGTQGFVAKDEKRGYAVVAFRGTEFSFRDVGVDLNAEFFNESEGKKLHKGFFESYNAVRDQIDYTTLEDSLLFFTGHSLGGAIAKLAAIIDDPANAAACYTFGAPRVGRLVDEALPKTPVFRVINDRDVVTLLPPPLAFGLGYRHSGEQYKFDHLGTLTEERNPSDRFVKLAVDRVKDIFSLFVNSTNSGDFAGQWLEENVTDHNSENYVELLHKWAVAKITQ